MMQNKITVILLFSITISTLISSTVSFSIHRHTATTTTAAVQTTPTRRTNQNYSSPSSTSIKPHCNLNQSQPISPPQATTPNQSDDDKDENDQQQDTSPLIIGKEMGQALQKIATEAGYLEAARKRNQEAKLKLLEQIRQEELEAERIRKEMEEKGNEGNYGPGDLSDYVGFKDDGFEASEGNDDTGGWGNLKKKKEQEEDSKDEDKEEPKLFLFGKDAGSDDDGIITSGGSGLIL